MSPPTAETTGADSAAARTDDLASLTSADGADAVVDELLGEELDWQRLVRTYPAASLVVAFAGGCWLGLRHGPAVFSAVTGFLTHEATRRVEELLGDAPR